MLELQDFVSSELDLGNIVGTYSIDLSAAFDLLRPDRLFEDLQNIVPMELLKIIMDFLSSRTFQVEINGIRSAQRHLKVGCVQGSILGPRLFTLYMRNLEKLLPKELKSKIVAYADDTYVSISGSNLDILKQQIITTMSLHDNYLQTIGMKTNVSKTELIFFKRADPILDKITVNGDVITAKENIKVLGVKFQHNLAWDSHINIISNKARAVLSKLKFLSRIVDLESLRRITTPHYFGLLYYACPVWLTETTTSKQWKTLNSLHYRALRTSARDHYFRLSKEELNKLFGRATPLQWMQYANAKIAITLYNLSTGPPITARLRDCSYINDRRPGLATITDRSKLRIGKQSLVNRLSCLRRISFNWTNGISKDLLRINLKKTFIPTSL